MCITSIGYAMLPSYFVTVLCFAALIAHGKLVKPQTSNFGNIQRTYRCMVNCSCVYDPTTWYVSANCSHRNFLAIPATFPEKLASLDLSYNKISELSGRPFRSLVNLQILVLSHNQITRLKNRSFIGLVNLTDLYLNGNMIRLLNESYPHLAFEGLRQLSVLHLETKMVGVAQLPDLLYPDKALSLLDHLTELHMNGIPFSYFGSGFLQLHSLSKLSLSEDHGLCSIQELQSDAFKNLKDCNLSYLDLTSCHIQNIDRNTFSHLTRINTLDLTQNNKLGFPRMSESIYGLINTSIQTLKLTRIQSGMKIEAKNEYFRYFPNLTLTHLYLDHIDIIKFDLSFPHYLPKSLEYLNIARNNLLYGQFLKEAYTLRHLRIVNGSYQNLDNTQTKHVPPAMSNIPDSNLVSNSANIEGHFKGIVKRNGVSAGIEMPAKLEYIYFRSSKLILPLISVSFTQNIIKYIDLSGNLIPAFIGPIIGLDHLTYFDLSENSASFLSASFFTNMSSIETLHLEKNRLAKYLQKDTDGHIFQELTNLKLLNLSANGIKYVPRRLLNNQGNLTQLYLNDNAIRDLNMKIDHMLKLEYLNISQNLIGTIKLAICQVIDTMARKRNLSVNLHNNILECTCSNIQFLQWLDSTSAILIHKDDYQCKFENNSIISLGKNVQLVIHTLQLQCIAPTVLLIASILLFTVISIIIMSAIIRHKKIQMGYYLSIAS